ncbi:MAG TPA: GvpL/GvpF family gas vesicle protein [Gaiellaceae bacterium]
MIHVYAFVDELERLPAVAGVGGAPLEVLSAAGLTAVAGRIDGRDDVDGHDAAVAHGVVVEALLDSAGAVVPVRFGERFADLTEFALATAERAASLRASLDHVRGCAEIVVRIPTTAPAQAATGTAYLHARLADEQRVAELGRRLHAFARATAETRNGEVAYLVRRAEAARALRAAEAFAAEHPDLTVRCTGPWAPYSFAGGAA